MKNFLIYGISRGLGRAITLSIPQIEDTVYGVSRSLPDYLVDKEYVKWIGADLSRPVEAVSKVKEVVGSAKIDYLIYNVGIWEHNAFEENYSFDRNSEKEIQQMIQVNITSSILAIQAFISNLKKSDNAKIILIGSTWGLDNHQGKEVVFSASKFALRGIVHALRESLRTSRIGISVINLGYLASEYSIETPIEEVLESTGRSLIPMQDVISAIKFVLSTSNATCVKEINMPAMQDTNV
ncbi:SDR family NAD(P)-dependent oxidoreductase [Sphingobacterium sp. UT-1RO-CII-1]|uniref:SDR family oxidoreductase n=1 Tax=Sphingobacterium sp. UT-1RO-CII-1 TaxID=2995225 RepID=UPI00227A2E8C|nr:SDR family oxidoreductase [Sphingobacterium sp. UT-1RO-CII-1]MCY4781292.1 SDR family NAD(P)-dependent oxidoreductase [Sphingobacterium sp. UT-1RO-CII-1]